MADRKSRLQNFSDRLKVEFKNSDKAPFIDPATGERAGNRYTLIANDVDLVQDPAILGKIDELSGEITNFFDTLKYHPEAFFAPGVYGNLEERQRSSSLGYLKTVVAKQFAHLVIHHFKQNSSIAKAVRWIFSKKYLGAEQASHGIYALEPVPLLQGQITAPVEKGDVGLDDLSYKELAAYFVRLEADEPEFLAALKDARAAKAAFNEAAPPTHLALPIEAPQLWADRQPGITATQFLRDTYAPWIEAGVMTRAAIKACDPQLYNAYAVRLHRHPEETLVLADTDRQAGRQPSTDLVSLVERRRKADREAKALKRAQAKMPHPDP